MAKRMDIETRRALAQVEGRREYFTREDKVEGAKKSYRNARRRCSTNPTKPFYRWYGAKGVQFLFESFQELLDDIGPRPTPRHSLDRKPGCRDYAPGNVRWGTKRQQSRNRTFPNKMGPKPRVGRVEKRGGGVGSHDGAKGGVVPAPDENSLLDTRGGGRECGESRYLRPEGGTVGSHEAPNSADLSARDLWSLGDQKPLMW